MRQWRRQQMRPAISTVLLYCCGGCERLAKEMNQCECHRVAYCGIECQKADRKQHRTLCKQGPPTIETELRWSIKVIPLHQTLEELVRVAVNKTLIHQCALGGGEATERGLDTYRFVARASILLQKNQPLGVEYLSGGLLRDRGGETATVETVAIKCDAWIFYLTGEERRVMGLLADARFDLGLALPSLSETNDDEERLLVEWLMLEALHLLKPHRKRLDEPLAYSTERKNRPCIYECVNVLMSHLMQK